jgi:uncharacterized glyoxalase superfamily protein PhnB
MATKLQKASIAIRQNKGRDLSPKWDNTEALSADEFTRHFHNAMSWYRLESSVKELKPKVIDWMGRNGYDRATIAAFKKTKDNRCSSTVGAIAACLIKGMPAQRADFNNGRNTEEWLKEQIVSIIEQGKNDIEEDEVVKEVKPIVPVVTIQDRIREQAGQMSEEIDAAIDAWITDPEAFDPKAFKMVGLLRGKGAKAAQTRYIKQIFQRGYDELVELSSGKADEQLREAYSHVARKNVKKLLEFYQSIFTACDQIAQEAKTLKKPRAKKVKPAEELVKKIKFKVSDDKLGISSVPPASIVGAQMAIVYNTKTRKLGVYGAKTSEGLGVKGASLINFSEKSTQKTLRKPDQQIKEFKEQNTANRVRTWFDKIKATEVKLNGRINAEIMIIKVFK